MLQPNHHSQASDSSSRQNDTPKRALLEHASPDSSPEPPLNKKRRVGNHGSTGSIESELQQDSERRATRTLRKTTMTISQYNASVLASQIKYPPIEVSPKNFVPPRRPPPPNLPALPFPPAKRAGRRGEFRPKTQHLTPAEIESLLPGSVFGHGRRIMQRGYWSLRDEKQLRRSWNWADERAFVDQGTSQYEIAVWAAMAELYRCTPRDLFRYGLRPAPSPRPGDERFYYALLRLLPHPFFRGDVALLRAALQVSVVYRVGENNHAPPLGPGWSREEPAFIRWLSQTPLDGRDEHWYRDRSRVAEMRWVTQVLRQLCSERTTDGQLGGGTDLPGWLAAYYQDTEHRSGRISAEKPTWRDGILFTVQKVDLDALEFALNQSYFRGAPGDGFNEERHRVSWYFKQYWKRLDKSGAGESERVGPLDRAEVKAQKRLAVLAERREALICIRMRRANELYRLLDIPPFDPDPGFHNWETCRRGTKYDPGPMIALECTFVLLPSTLEWLVSSIDADARALIERDLTTVERLAHTRRPTTSYALLAERNTCGPPTTSTVYSTPSRWRSYLCDALSPRTHLRWAREIAQTRMSSPDYKYDQVDDLLLSAATRIDFLEPTLDELDRMLQHSKFHNQYSSSGPRSGVVEPPLLPESSSLMAPIRTNGPGQETRLDGLPPTQAEALPLRERRQPLVAPLKVWV